jgi:hypothetical protein
MQPDCQIKPQRRPVIAFFVGGSAAVKQPGY